MNSLKILLVFSIILMNILKIESVNRFSLIDNIKDKNSVGLSYMINVNKDLPDNNFFSNLIVEISIYTSDKKFLTKFTTTSLIQQKKGELIIIDSIISYKDLLALIKNSKDDHYMQVSSYYYKDLNDNNSNINTPHKFGPELKIIGNFNYDNLIKSFSAIIFLFVIGLLLILSYYYLNKTKNSTKRNNKNQSIKNNFINGIENAKKLFSNIKTLNFLKNFKQHVKSDNKIAPNFYLYFSRILLKKISLSDKKYFIKLLINIKFQNYEKSRIKMIINKKSLKDIFNFRKFFVYWASEANAYYRNFVYTVKSPSGLIQHKLKFKEKVKSSQNIFKKVMKKNEALLIKKFSISNEQITFIKHNNSINSILQINSTSLEFFIKRLNFDKEKLKFIGKNNFSLIKQTKQKIIESQEFSIKSNFSRKKFDNNFSITSINFDISGITNEYLVKTSKSENNILSSDKEYINNNKINTITIENFTISNLRKSSFCNLECELENNFTTNFPNYKTEIRKTLLSNLKMSSYSQDFASFRKKSFKNEELFEQNTSLSLLNIRKELIETKSEITIFASNEDKIKLLNSKINIFNDSLTIEKKRKASYCKTSNEVEINKITLVEKIKNINKLFNSQATELLTINKDNSYKLKKLSKIPIKSLTINSVIKNEGKGDIEYYKRKLSVEKPDKYFSTNILELNSTSFSLKSNKEIILNPVETTTMNYVGQQPEIIKEKEADEHKISIPKFRSNFSNNTNNNLRSIKNKKNVIFQSLENHLTKSRNKNNNFARSRDYNNLENLNLTSNLKFEDVITHKYYELSSFQPQQNSFDNLQVNIPLSNSNTQNFKTKLVEVSLKHIFSTSLVKYMTKFLKLYYFTKKITNTIEWFVFSNGKKTNHKKSKSIRFNQTDKDYCDDIFLRNLLYIQHFFKKIIIRKNILEYSKKLKRLNWIKAKLTIFDVARKKRCIIKWKKLIKTEQIKSSYSIISNFYNKVLNKRKEVFINEAKTTLKDLFVSFILYGNLKPIFKEFVKKTKELSS